MPGGDHLILNLFIMICGNVYANAILFYMVRYDYREGVTFDKKKNRWFLAFTSLVVIVTAAYVAAIYLAPRLVAVPFTNLTVDKTATRISSSKAGQYGDRLFIPQINVDAAITKGGDKTALGSGVWQRQTELGNPAKGGNLVLSGYKFTLDTTPWRTRAKSPFCNLGKLKDGDQLTVDYDGTRYVYEVDRVSGLSSSNDAEQKSNDNRLTLYAAEGDGSAATGPMVSAKLLGPAADQNSGPKE